MSEHAEQIVCPWRETGPNNLRNSEGAVIELLDGRLLLIYTHFYADGEDFGAGDIRGKTSEDGGKTWSAPFLVRSNTANCNTGRPSLVRLPGLFDGLRQTAPMLGMVYFDLNQFYHSRMCFTTSLDEGQSWSREVQINQTGMLGFYGQRAGSTLVLACGRIIVPSFAMFGGMCASFMYYSDNGGVTWERSLGEISVKLSEGGHTFGYSDFEEPSVAELHDGRLMCLGRTRIGQLYQSFSNDRGVTWSEAEPTGLASSYSPALLKTIPGTGDLLCIWNQASGQEIADRLGRIRLSSSISRDDGQTWTCFKNLESLDDTVQVEPESDSLDAVSELHAIKARQAVKVSGTRVDYPEEVTRRYPRWPGYIHNDYPSVAFTRNGTVVIAYNVSDGEVAGLVNGLKLVVKPIDWLYR